MPAVSTSPAVTPEEGLGGAPRRLRVHAAITAASFVAYIAARAGDGPAFLLLSAFGVSACGWAWLLTRALFDLAPHDAGWPRAVVGVLTASGALSVLAPDGGWMREVAVNAYVLAGSAALVLTFVEAFQTRGALIDAGERRFRASFLIVYSVLMATSVLGAWEARASVEVVCAAFSLIAGAAAVVWRARHQLRASPRPAPARRAATEGDAHLAERITRLLDEEALYMEPSLRIGDLAARLGQPEHRVSQAIASSLGFPNFNQLINHRRIKRARVLLTTEPRRPILQIAFDCGFGSLGPFNRAFKAQTGLTPRSFRALAGEPQAGTVSKAGVFP